MQSDSKSNANQGIDEEDELEAFMKQNESAL
jgi:hypothetical protein